VFFDFSECNKLRNEEHQDVYAKSLIKFNSIVILLTLLLMCIYTNV